MALIKAGPATTTAKLRVPGKKVLLVMSSQAAGAVDSRSGASSNFDSLQTRFLSPNHQLLRDASRSSTTTLRLVAMAPVSDRTYFPPLDECLSGERVLL